MQQKKKRKMKMRYKIIAKYIKDLNFKIPNAKAFFYYQKILVTTKLKQILKAINSKTK